MRSLSGAGAVSSSFSSGQQLVAPAFVAAEFGFDVKCQRRRFDSFVQAFDLPPVVGDAGLLSEAAAEDVAAVIGERQPFEGCRRRGPLRSRIEAADGRESLQGVFGRRAPGVRMPAALGMAGNEGGDGPAAAQSLGEAVAAGRIQVAGPELAAGRQTAVKDFDKRPVDNSCCRPLRRHWPNCRQFSLRDLRTRSAAAAGACRASSRSRLPIFV